MCKSTRSSLQDPYSTAASPSIWCQWCLGHLSDPQLIAFLKCAHRALRPADSETHPSGSRSVLVVKENVCEDLPGGEAQAILDEEDSSLTRCVLYPLIL